MQDKINNLPIVESDQRNEFYGQIISCVATNYDMTFIFYKFDHVRKDEGFDVTPSLKEACRISMPLKSAQELKDVLVAQFSSNGGVEGINP